MCRWFSDLSRRKHGLTSLRAFLIKKVQMFQLWLVWKSAYCSLFRQDCISLSLSLSLRKPFSKIRFCILTHKSGASPPLFAVSRYVTNCWCYSIGLSVSFKFPLPYIEIVKLYILGIEAWILKILFMFLWCFEYKSLAFWNSKLGTKFLGHFCR